MRNEIGKGAIWMLLLRLFDRIVGIASTLILARLLVPADFGLVAMAMSVIALIELATAFGFDVVLIQLPNPERRHFDTAWTLTIVLYCGCGILIGLLAIPAAAFYKDPRLVNLMLVIGAGWVLRGFENSGIVEFRRKMDFSKEFVFFAGPRLVGAFVTVVTVLVFRSYWALVAGMVTGRIASLALSYVMVSYRPSLDLSVARELLSFSKWLLVNNAVLSGVVRFPHFLIGRLLGPQALGLFTISYEFATLPATEVSMPVNRAAFAGYSRMVEDKIKFKETFLDVGASVALVALPASAGIAVIADPLVRVLLGENWLEAVPIIPILAISAALVAVSGNNGIAHLALGYPNFLTLQSLLRLVVLVVLGVILAPAYGIVGVAIAELCGAAVTLLASYPVVFRRLNISVIEYGTHIWRPVVATVTMAVVVRVVEDMLGVGYDVVSALLMLTVGIVIGVCTYVILIAFMWWLCGKPDGADKILFNKVSDLIRTNVACLS